MLKVLSLFCVLYTVVRSSALLDCDYDGVVHKSGDSFPASDGCNNCFCANGAVACTLKLCLPKATCTYGNGTYHNGDSFKALDGCNTCYCQAGVISCTEMACFPSTAVPF